MNWDISHNSKTYRLAKNPKPKSTLMIGGVLPQVGGGFY